MIRSHTNSLLGDIEKLLISGENSRASHLLKSTNIRTIERADLGFFCSLCRRLGYPQTSIKLLNPIVRATGKKQNKPSAEEISEYAAALTYIGATEEASQLLLTVNAQDYPQSMLFQAFSLFAMWDYGSSLKPLTQFINTQTISEYQKTIGQVNLAAALVYERKCVEASKLISSLLDKTKRENQLLLHGNLWEIAAQNELFQRNWGSAKACLKSSKDILSKHLSTGHLYVDKWQIILCAMENKSSHSRNQLKGFKLLARQQSQWEVVRDCDRYEAIIFEDQDLLNQVCIGTPYPKFIETTLKLFGPGYLLPNVFHRHLLDGSKARELDLLQGKIVGSKLALKTGLALHRLMLSLNSDFYRPLRIAVLHHHIFPNEFYNPLTSPKRVHEKIRLLRRWFVKAKVPLKITQEHRFYSLKASQPMRIKITVPKLNLPPLPVTLLRLKELLPNTFSSSEVARTLDISPRSALRLVSLGLKTQALEAFGQGRNTSYRWLKQS